MEELKAEALSKLSNITLNTATIAIICLFIATFFAMLHIVTSKTDANLIKEWKSEFQRLGEFIQDKEIVDVYYMNLTGFDTYNRLKITVRDYQKNTTKIFKIPNTAQLAVTGKKETYPIDVQVKAINTTDTSQWKIQLSSNEKVDIEYPQHIYEINIFTPSSAECVEYSSR